MGGLVILNLVLAMSDSVHADSPLCGLHRLAHAKHKRVSGCKLGCRETPDGQASAHEAEPSPHKVATNKGGFMIISERNAQAVRV